MARPRLPDTARVPIGLEVSEADAARIDQVLARPEFTGWTRAEWCREIIRSALRYYTGDSPEPDPGRARAPAPQPGSPAEQSPSLAPQAAGSPALAAGASSPAIPPGGSQPVPAAPESSARPECPHPPDARDYDTGTCVACGAILWD
jgi:hypothetical protein